MTPTVEPPRSTTAAANAARVGWRHTSVVRPLQSLSGALFWFARLLAVWAHLVRRRSPRPQINPHQLYDWYEEKEAAKAQMETAVRPDVATGGDPAHDPLRIVVDGEAAEALLRLMRRSEAHNPRKTARQEQAARLALHLKRTGHLPA